MSESSFNSMKARFNYDRMTNWGVTQKTYSDTMGDKVNVRGKDKNVYADPFVRLREDKLRSFKRALYYSYQSAVIVFQNDDRQYHFRCLINHDKLKVDYQDKLLSIPFKQIPVELQKSTNLPLDQRMVDTGTLGHFTNSEGQVSEVYRVKAGDVFKWVSGNDGYMPDSYWMITLQYSEQTAYFRGQIRRAEDEIEIIPIEEDGSEGEPLLYRGWTTGPNEDQAIWNVKKGVVWNDLYYTKILYITKDENTQAYFRRFERVIINGQTWEIQGFNDNYGTSSKNMDGGIIRVALKETYTSTDEVIKQMDDEKEQNQLEILGPTVIQSYDTVTYTVPNGTSTWNVPAAAPVSINSLTTTKVKLDVEKVSSATTFVLGYGTKGLNITVKPFK